ncbi:SMR family transporter [Methanobrevibacter arboriphilus]|uniref:SMR family transporter n=1 Tax=Methanobrevibacter arboriphilus TaxID=39441 RepID=UPI0012E1C86F
MNPWIFIVLFGLIEIGWAYTLKLSEMYTKPPLYAGINIILMIVSLYFLTKTLKKYH